MDASLLARENTLLKARLVEVEAALADAQEAQRRMESIIRILQREKFGAKSEKLSPDQFNLPLEDVELAQGVLEAAQEKAQAVLKGPSEGESTIAIAAICRPICRGWSASSSLRAPNAPAAVARW